MSATRNRRSCCTRRQQLPAAPPQRQPQQVRDPPPPPEQVGDDDAPHVGGGDQAADRGDDGHHGEPPGVAGAAPGGERTGDGHHHDQQDGREHVARGGQAEPRGVAPGEPGPGGRQLPAHHPGGDGEPGGRVGGVPEVPQDLPQVPGALGELLVHRRRPEHHEEPHGHPDRVPAGTTVPDVVHGLGPGRAGEPGRAPPPRRGERGHGQDERQVAHVGLHRERAGNHRHRDERPVADGHGPHREQEHDEPQERGEGVPRVDQERGPEPVDQRRGEQERPHAERQAPAPVGEQHDRGEGHGARQPRHEQHAGLPEQPVAGCEEPEQERTGVVPAEP